MNSEHDHELARRLGCFPRAELVGGPTPLEPLRRLSAALGQDGPATWAKRDDAIPLGLGGDKVRKLEFLVGDAKVKGCDTLIARGAVQSNHCRLTAAANKAGLGCELLLADRVASNDPTYRRSRNRLLRPYIVPEGGGTPAGGLGAIVGGAGNRRTGCGSRRGVQGGVRAQS